MLVDTSLDAARITNATTHDMLRFEQRSGVTRANLQRIANVERGVFARRSS
jgi:hypothetical protein